MIKKIKELISIQLSRHPGRVVIGIISLAALAAVGIGVGIHAKNKNKAA